jgi:hypothetical protein
MKPRIQDYFKNNIEKVSQYEKSSQDVQKRIILKRSEL